MPKLRIVLKGPMFKFKKILKRLKHRDNRRIRRSIELVLRGAQPPHNGCSPRVRKRKRKKAVSFR